MRAELASALELADPFSVSFLNDAEAFLLGEWWAGAARGHSRVIGITLGTGLGSAFLDRGGIVDSGPEVPPEGSLHLVPFRGAPVEDLISRRGILAAYGASAGVDVRQIADRARDGEERAQQTFAFVATALAEFLGPWVAAFAPGCVVVGGSIARSWDLLETQLAEGLPGVDVVAAARIDEAALLGAARHVALEAGS